MENGRKNRIAQIAVFGGILVAAILIFGTVWTGRSATRDTEKAVRSVSLLYLDELADRREQVVEDSLNDNINKINIALSLMNDENLKDLEHLQDYQRHMRTLFNLERFGLVNENGLIYTSRGIEHDIEQYPFDLRAISGSEIGVRNVESSEKKVVIAVPVENITFNGEKIVACFMEIDMDVMLKGFSLNSQSSGATFCNIYTSDGSALSSTVLGGLAEEDNLLEALAQAEFEPGYSLDQVILDFSEGRRGVVSFSYNGIRETLSYIPVPGTNWLLTYLIRERCGKIQNLPLKRKPLRRKTGSSIRRWSSALLCRSRCSGRKLSRSSRRE